MTNKDKTEKDMWLTVRKSRRLVEVSKREKKINGSKIIDENTLSKNFPKLMKTNQTFRILGSSMNGTRLVQK